GRGGWRACAKRPHPAGGGLQRAAGGRPSASPRYRRRSAECLSSARCNPPVASLKRWFLVDPAEFRLAPTFIKPSLRTRHWLRNSSSPRARQGVQKFGRLWYACDGRAKFGRLMLLTARNGRKTFGNERAGVSALHVLSPGRAFA